MLVQVIDQNNEFTAFIVKWVDYIHKWTSLFFLRDSNFSGMFGNFSGEPSSVLTNAGFMVARRFVDD